MFHLIMGLIFVILTFLSGYVALNMKDGYSDDGDRLFILMLACATNVSIWLATYDGGWY